MAALGVLLVGLISVAFRGSWTAHRDAALAAHFDPTGANLYPFVPDGLIVLALIAAMILRHSRGARFYCLTVVAIFTLTSYVINHLHGLGKLVAPLHWGIVALVALQVIAAIFFGSHILVHVFRHLWPGVGGQDTVAAAVVEPRIEDGPAPEGGPEAPIVEPVPVEPDLRDVASWCTPHAWTPGSSYPARSSPRSDGSASGRRATSRPTSRSSARKQLGGRWPRLPGPPRRPL